MTDLLDAALKLAGEGVPVFPCGLDKAPRTPNGFKDASTDPEYIKRCSWSASMIGAAVPPGVVVVDVDPRNGGTETIDQLKKLGRTLPATRIAKTGGGGRHFYYRVPEDVALRSTLGPGVDIKKSGKGYVISPPSPGYEWLLPGVLAEAPQWLLDELAVTESALTSSEAADAKYMPFEDGTPYGLRALAAEIASLSTQAEGGRNNALNRAAFSLSQLVAGGELREERVLADLETVAERIGLEPDETAATLRSAWTRGISEPRQAPERDPDAEADTTARAPVALPNLPEPLGSGESEERMWVDWMVDEKPPPFYLHPLIPESAYVLVFGATEASKSMVWHGLLAQASNRGLRCSVYSLENPAHADRERLRRLRPDPANFRLTNASIDFNDPRQLEALASREMEWDTNLLLIDTYSHAFNSRSEDGNAKAIEFARRVRWLMQTLPGLTVIVIDHTGYAQPNEPRDASAKRQQVDVAILMEKQGEWRRGQPAGFKMENKKAARFGNPFYCRGEVRDVALDGGREGLEIAFTGGVTPEWQA